MVYYNAGNRILSSDEYYAELIFKWRLALFTIGGSWPVVWPMSLSLQNGKRH